MSDFVDGFGSKATGYPKINLDLVARLERVEKTEHRDAGFECFDTRNVLIGYVSEHDVPDGRTIVIPAADRSILVEVSIFENRVHVIRHPVIAWRMERDPVTWGAEPVIPSGLQTICGDSSWFVQLSTGVCVLAGGDTVSSYDVALQEVAEWIVDQKARRLARDSRSKVKSSEHLK